MMLWKIKNIKNYITMFYRHFPNFLILISLIQSITWIYSFFWHIFSISKHLHFRSENKPFSIQINIWKILVYVQIFTFYTKKILRISVLLLVCYSCYHLYLIEIIQSSRIGNIWRNSDKCKNSECAACWIFFVKESLFV